MILAHEEIEQKKYTEMHRDFGGQLIWQLKKRVKMIFSISGDGAAGLSYGNSNIGLSLHTTPQEKSGSNI